MILRKVNTADRLLEVIDTMPNSRVIVSVNQQYQVVAWNSNGAYLYIHDVPDSQVDYIREAITTRFTDGRIRALRKQTDLITMADIEDYNKTYKDIK